MISSAPEIQPGQETSQFSPQQRADIESRTIQIGKQIFSDLHREKPWILQRRWWDDRLMDWSMSDEQLKVQLFRFVDVLPMLTTDRAIANHLAEYLGSVQRGMPWGSRSLLRALSKTSPTRWLVAKVARMGAADFARRFIAGSNAQEVLQTAKRNRQAKRAFTLDILGEAVTSQVEADRYFKAYLDLIDSVAPTVNSWEEVPVIDRDIDGPLPRMNLSVKLSALDPHFDPIDADGVARRVGERLKVLLRKAKEHQAFINVDMESYEKKDLTLRIFRDVLEQDEFRSVRDVGIVLQCYLRDSGRDFVELRDWARRRGTSVWVRLVKGAYWEHETVHAQAMGWPIPVYQQKWESDDNYERQLRFIMENTDALKPALGSHNLRSIAHGIAVAEELGLPPDAYEVQMLYGMADAEKQTLVQRGHRVRVYMPYGELIPGMAYLVRRLLENTSNDSFLRAGLKSDVSPEKLLQPPSGERSQNDVSSGTSPEGPPTVDRPTVTDQRLTASRELATQESHPISHDASAMSATTQGHSTKATFKNEPPIDFAIESNRDKMLQELQAVEAKFGKLFPVIINGESLDTPQQLHSVDPSQSSRIVGSCGMATTDQMNQAVASAKTAQVQWGLTSAEERAALLNKLADRLRDRLFELSAWEVFECGKPWREATNDICEAIDFCRFYAQGAIDMQGDRGADVPGEENRFEYLPRGVTAVIAPWNFPLAIIAGMATAALATGNSVVLKPAEQASVMAGLLMEVIQEAGFPPGVVNYLPGDGEVIGAGLVSHPDVAVIAFTGSRPVGLAINAQAAQASASGTPMVKRVIAEMGGKNAIIVDRDADLDEAVLGVAKSAFGFQGQKCSACSRVLVLEDVYETFLERLVESARSLVVGPARDPATQVGPVIDDEAKANIQRYIEVGKREGECVLATEVGELANQGYFVGPHIFKSIRPEDQLAQEEIFGPVLAVIRVKDLDEAINVANGTEYALTGGMFSRNPASLDRAKREMQVGNLYLNRNITGALVGRQPFGGFKMSGIGSKAGGDDYLLQFVVPRTITENTMRRGFAPNIEAQAQ